MENVIAQTTQERASALTGRINANARVAAEMLVSIGRDLKTMRDEKLYTALGCANFEEYCDKHTEIRQREAYNFIRCFETYGGQLSELSGLGVTKLTLMTVLDESDRAELIESGDAENLSVRELQKRIDELKNKYEQLTLDYDRTSNEKQGAENEVEELKKQIDALAKTLKAEQDKNKELESRPVEVAVEKPSDEEIAKIKADAQKAAKKEISAVKKQHEQEMAKLQDELARNYEKSRATEVEAVEMAKNAEIERLKSENAVLQSNASKPAPDSTKEKVKFYIGEIQTLFTAIISIIKAVEDTDEQGKYKSALKATVEKLGGAADEI